MVGLDVIRKDMEAQLERDQALVSVEVNADTLDEALSDAAVQLDTRVANLEYEILERGSDGFLGLAKKPWKLRIYQNEVAVAKKKVHKAQETAAEESAEEENKIVDQDGLYYIRHFGDNISLKVVLPVGNGRSVDAKSVINDAKRADTLDLDEGKIKKFANAGTNGVYEVVGQYKHVKGADSTFAVDISEDEMLGTITVSAPAMSGSDLSKEQIIQALETQGAVAGIEEDKIDEFVDNPVYNVPFEVAAAIKPVDGKDAYIEYKFETDSTKVRLKEDQYGKVNFKELHQIQNVLEGQPLAQKIPPEKGKHGKTIRAHFLEAKDGKDIKIPLGQNVEIDKDGVTVLATKAGRVILEGDRISVEPVIEYDSIGPKTGNIDFAGTVIIKGNVEDNFEVKAKGNIEINGIVGKSRLESEHGDIIVSSGIYGHDEGVVKCAGSLWAKFIQSAKVESENFVIVSDSIMNSEVSAMKRIILNGKKAQITGGHLFATEEVAAKNIGSPGGGTETVIEVGIDPRAKHRLEDLLGNQNALVKELEDVDAQLQSLANYKKARRTLPKDKEEQLSALKERRQEIVVETEKINDETAQIQQHLQDLKAVGKVKASGTVFAGVKIYVRDVLDEVRVDVKGCTFYLEGGFMRRGKYENPNMEGVTAPEGYSSF